MFAKPVHGLSPEKMLADRREQIERTALFSNEAVYLLKHETQADLLENKRELNCTDTLCTLSICFQNDVIRCRYLFIIYLFI